MRKRLYLWDELCVCVCVCHGALVYFVLYVYIQSLVGTRMVHVLVLIFWGASTGMGIGTGTCRGT